jgi:signal transduction histidine kinase
LDSARQLWAWAARRERGTDVALAAAAFLTALFFAFDGWAEVPAVGPMAGIPFAGLVLLVIACVALYWRRAYPLLVLAATGALTIVASGIGYTDPTELAPCYAMLVALYSVGRYVDDERWSYVGLAGAFAVVGFDYLIGEMTAVAVGFGFVVLSVVWYIGRRLRERAERSEELRRERAADSDRAVQAERTRIARELHDVVAHRVSLMTVQAGAAKTVAAEDPQAALRAMEAVEHAGRQALDELRHLLGVLRPSADGGSLGPQPGLLDVPRLVDQFREAGLDVSLSVSGATTDLPARVDLSAYRIIQEALTNVLKHAGPGAQSDVRISIDVSTVAIEISDDGQAVTSLPGSGHGIMGMRERAVLLGGSLAAGPLPGGGFRVVARLPIGGGAT